MRKNYLFKLGVVAILLIAVAFSVYSSVLIRAMVVLLVMAGYVLIYEYKKQQEDEDDLDGGMYI